MFENQYLLNVFNHNQKGNPHPQYDNFKTYNSKHNPDGTSRFAKIFEGNFSYHPDIEQNDREREYNRLLYKMIIYNMDSDEASQVVTDLAFYLFVNDSGIQFKVRQETILGDNSKNFVMFYKTTNGITNVRMYANVNNNYEKIKILPIIYDTVRNYSTPYHINAGGEGVNTKEKLDFLYRTFSQEPLLLQGELDSINEGYIKYPIIESRHSLCVDNTYPELKFRSSGEEISKIMYHNQLNCMVLESKGIDWRINGGIIPLDTAKSIGAYWANYKRGYFSEGVQLGVCTSSSRPTIGLTNGLTIFDTTINKLITYNSGKWYSNGVEV